MLYMWYMYLVRVGYIPPPMPVTQVQQQQAESAANYVYLKQREGQ